MPAPLCPVHREEVPLAFKGLHYGREHWRCPQCSVFLSRLPTTNPPIPDHDPHGTPDPLHPGQDLADYHDPEI